MYFRAIKSRYDEDDGAPSFEEEDMLDGGMNGYRKALREVVAEFRRQRRGGKKPEKKSNRRSREARNK